MRCLHMLLGFTLMAALVACQAPQNDAPLLSKKSPVELRAMQARQFETGDRVATLRAVIATLQDLGYSLDKVDASSGTVTGTKLAMLKISASVYPRGVSQLVVRADALVRVPPRWYQVDALEFYQKDFFDPLSRALFLQANTVPAEDVPSNPVTTTKPAAPPTS